MKLIRQSLSIVIIASVFMLLGMVLMLLLMPQFTGHVANAIDDIPAPEIAMSDVLSEQERVFAEIYEVASQSVVSITIAIQQSPNAPFEPVSTGSGFVVDTQG